MQKKEGKKNTNKLFLVIIGLGVLIAVAITLSTILINATPEGHWVRVDIRPTEAMLGGLSESGREALQNSLREALDDERMEIQFSEDSSGVMIVERSSVTESISFEWDADARGQSLTMRMTVPFPTEMVMSYRITRLNSRLTLTNEGEGIMIFERIR